MQDDPSKPTEEARLLNLAMKAVLAVAIASIVSTIIIVGYSPHPDLIGSDDPYAEPNVAFANPNPIGGGQWEVKVAGVSDYRDLEDFWVILLKNRTIWDEMDPLAEGLTTHMSFTDYSGDGKVGVGDSFLITCDSGSSYQLSIIWKDSGNERGRALWET